MKIYWINEKLTWQCRILQILQFRYIWRRIYIAFRNNWTEQILHGNKDRHQIQEREFQLKKKKIQVLALLQCLKIGITCSYLVLFMWTHNSLLQSWMKRTSTFFSVAIYATIFFKTRKISHWSCDPVNLLLFLELYDIWAIYFWHTHDFLAIKGGEKSSIR